MKNNSLIHFQNDTNIGTIPFFCGIICMLNNIETVLLFALACLDRLELLHFTTALGNDSGILNTFKYCSLCVKIISNIIQSQFLN